MSCKSDEHQTLVARVRFLTTAEGGRFTAPMSGVRSQLRLISGSMTSCVVTAIDGSESIRLGEDTDVKIVLLFPEVYEAENAPPVDVALFEGNKLVATGIFVVTE